MALSEHLAECHFLTKENKMLYEYAIVNLDRFVEFWKNVLWSVVTKLELLYQWSSEEHLHHHGQACGRVLLWACFAAAGSGNLGWTSWNL